MAKTEVVYLDREGSIDLILKAEDADGVAEAQDLSGVTRMTLQFDDGTVIDDSSSTSPPIKWSGAGFVTGEVRLELGGESLPLGYQEVRLDIFDAVHTNGLPWGIVKLDVRESASPELVVFDADGQIDGTLVDEETLGLIRQRAQYNYPTIRAYTTADAAAGRTSSALFETGTWQSYADLLWFDLWAQVVDRFPPGVTSYDVTVCFKTNSDG